MLEYTVTSQFIPPHTALSWNTVNPEKSADLKKPIARTVWIATVNTVFVLAHLLALLMLLPIKV